MIQTGQVNGHDLALGQHGHGQIGQSHGQHGDELGGQYLEALFEADKHTKYALKKCGAVSDAVIPDIRKGG